MCLGTWFLDPAHCGGLLETPEIAKRGGDTKGGAQTKRGDKLKTLLANDFRYIYLLCVKFSEA